MTTTLFYPSEVKLTTGAELRVKELPSGLRTPASYTITAATPGSSMIVTLTAAAVIGAKTLSVSALSAALPSQSLLFLGAACVVTSAAAASSATSLTIYPLNFDLATATQLNYDVGALTANSTLLPVAALPVLLDVGDRLTFGSQTLRVTGRSPAGAIQLRVSAIVTTITSGATASTKGLLAVAGVTSSPVPSPEPKVIETTNLLSGIGKEQQVTGVSHTMKVMLDLIKGNLGGDVITDILRDKTKYKKEVYFELTMEDGELHYGVAIPTAGPESGELQDKRKMDITMQIQGLTYGTIKSDYVFF